MPPGQPWFADVPEATAKEPGFPEDLVEELLPLPGFRNVLIHEYDALDSAIVLAAVGEACRGFTTYVAAVERYLERQPRTAFTR